MGFLKSLCRHNRLNSNLHCGSQCPMIAMNLLLIGCTSALQQIFPYLQTLTTESPDIAARLLFEAPPSRSVFPKFRRRRAQRRRQERHFCGPCAFPFHKLADSETVVALFQHLSLRSSIRELSKSPELDEQSTSTSTSRSQPLFGSYLSLH
jgi:hypothetical protein